MLEFHHDTVQHIRKEYGLDQPGRMDEAIDILDEWVKTQKHFVRTDFPRNYLETSIITAKGSLERAKSRLDKLCTLKTLVPHFFGDFDVKNDFKEFDGILSHAFLPKLTEDHHRVIVIRPTGNKFHNTVVLQYFRIIIMWCEYLRYHECADGFVGIVDFFQVDVMELLSKFNITDLHQVATILIEGYGARLRGIHLLSKSKLINTFVNTVKIVLPEKLRKRLHTHSSLESLHKHLESDKRILPHEYGGQERSLNDLHNEWVEVLSTSEFRNYLKEMSKASTNESLRSTDVFNTEYMGMPGTFRALQVD